MFAERRQRFMDQMEPGSVALFLSAPRVIRNHDVEYRYRQNSDFYYLTGLEEDQSAAILAPGHPRGEFLLFVKPRDPELELWVGPTIGPEGVSAQYGADCGCAIGDLPDLLTEMLQDASAFHFRIGDNAAHDRLAIEAINRVRAMYRNRVRPPKALVDPTFALHEMRVHKSPEEIALIRRACDLTARGHRHLMEHVRPGMTEYQVEALIDGHFRSHGAQRNGFPTIVAAGPNATVLHYMRNDAVLRAGELLLVDAGAEVDYYSGDITRTFPVGATFSGAQRAVYEVVLAAQLAAISAVAPGVAFDAIHDAALTTLVDGLLQLGLLTGHVDQVLEDHSYKRFFMHKTSHWMGIDVHDVGEYGSRDSWRLLEPGMVFTIEPGIYIPADAHDVDTRFRGIGVRIEDDIVVTPDGYEDLTSAVPKTVSEIETLAA